MTTEYSARSSARRAAKAAGLNPDLVKETKSGKFRLPDAATTEAADQALSLGLLGPAPAPETDITIPAALLVKNRKPLTAAQQKRLAEVQATSGAANKRVDHRKPQSTSWEEWDAHLAAAAASKREKSLERIAALQAKQGDKQAARAARLPKPKREDAFQPDQVIRVSGTNPCRAGTAAHAVFEKYRDGMTVAQFTKAAQGACPGKLRPIDYLIYDSRKGRISVEAASAVPAVMPKPKGKKA